MHRFLPIALICACALVIAGCGKRETAVASGDRDQILHWGNLSEPTDLDPAIITSAQDYNIVTTIFEGLTVPDPKDLHPTPGVAERWETSADGLTWTFHLRADARWSDGEPVTAGDFIYGFHRMLSPGLAAEYAYMLYPMRNAEAFNEGRITDFSQVGASAPDPRTLVVSLAHPVAYLASLVSHSSWFPVNRACIEKYGKMDQRGSMWTRPGNLIGNGPFNLAEWRPNQIIKLTKSATYWDRDAVRLKQIWIYPIENETTEEAAFRAGQLHITAQVPIEKLPFYRNSPAHVLVQNTTLGTYLYRFNVTKPPLNDPRVRRALSMAIDRKRMVEEVTKGGQQPAFSLTPPGVAGFNPPEAVRTDVAEAQKLMAEAGYPGGKDFPKVEILFNTTEGHRKIAEAIQQMWRKSLGIQVTLANQEAKVQEDAMRQLNYQIARYAWFGDYLDPSTFIDLMETNGGNNQTGWGNAEYDELVRKARASSDNAVRYACFRRCEEILGAEAPIAPIYYYTRNYLMLPEVKGWYPTILDIHPMKGVYLDPSAAR